MTGLKIKFRTLGTRSRILMILLAAALVWFIFCLPERIFDQPYSTVLEASNGQLLSASIAADGQWRFPESESVPGRFAQALITFEDKRFYYHPGVDPLSMARAAVQNLTEGKIVSGGSTLTMQVIRLSRTPAPRNFLEKVTEMILATRLEFAYSKKEVLALYASHAPFGGNVVGLEAACWRYFGRSSEQMSWGEAAMLAVLPNAPSLLHPGKNRNALRRKRDGLLDKLRLAGKIDSMTCVLAKLEPIPEKPRPLPMHARHLLGRIRAENMSQQKVTSTVDYNLQLRVEEKLQAYHNKLRTNQIYNGAVLVLDVATGETIAYAGNVYGGDPRRGNEVDIITSPRSTGSILKPFLYAACLDEGMILPATLLPDIPVMLNAFAPRNFSKEYDGAVSAGNALIRSLNVPSVFLLRDYRYEKFYTLLGNTGFTRLRRPPDHYGLSLILGGAEGTLWDITGMYASLARTLNNYFQYAGNSRYRRTDFHPPSYVRIEKTEASELESTSWLSASSIFLTLETLKELYRPLEESGWRYFNTSKKIAWKTGTSFGFRDAWAVGVTGDYVVGVWIGNADGEGRPGLTGTSAAAPLMFDIFSILPATNWFDAPRSEMEQIATCRRSGQRASIHCEQTDTVWATRPGLLTSPCVYHKTIHLSIDRRYQVHSQCADVADIQHEKWFVLPPVQEHYYRQKNISYKPLPPFKPGCATSRDNVMDLVYPKPNARILIPRDFDGKEGRSVFELAHRNEKISVFWHLDGVFIGMTRGNHRLALNPIAGDHVLTVVDENGHSLEERFTVISRL